MQLRTSPGGSMLNSLRRRPLEPPSSLTVTTPESSVIIAIPAALENTLCGVLGGADVPGGAATYFLSPLSRVERPVPPPMATTLNSRAPAECWRPEGIAISRDCRIPAPKALAFQRPDPDTAVP